MFKRLRKQKNRLGAASVEFALVAPIFFVTLFTCIEFSRFWMVETTVEAAVFQTARDLSLFGAQVDEGRPFAANILARSGIDEFEIVVSPFSDEVLQTEIDDSTTRVAVTISVAANEISILNVWTANKTINRSADFQTNRPN